MVELKGRQQQEMGGELQFHSCLKWLHVRMHVCIFESSQREGSYVGDLTVLGFGSTAVGLWISRM